MFGLIPRRKEKRGERFWPYEPPMEIPRREFAPLFERMFSAWPAFAESEGTPPYGPEMEDVGEAVVVRESGVYRLASARQVHRTFFEAAFLCHTLKKVEQTGRRAVLGDPLEIALVRMAEAGLSEPTNGKP